MEGREQMNNTTSLQTLSLEELTMITGGAKLVEKGDSSDSSDNGGNCQRDGSPEPGTGDRDIGAS